MRALVFLAALCLASATAFPQALPKMSTLPSTVCSIPLLRFTAPDIDPLIVKKMPSASNRTSQAKVPAPPCDEPAAKEPTLAQNLGGLREHLMAVLQKYVSSRKPAAVAGQSDPVPYVSAPLPGALGESIKP
jgi:hypothetical protein